MQVVQTGPELLTPAEARRALLTAAGMMSDEIGVTNPDESVELAKLAYRAYGEQTGFKNFQGNPMPSWEDLGDTIRSAWVAAAGAVSTYLTGPPAQD